MIYAMARMKIPSKDRDEALEILGSVIQRVRFETGCVSCNAYRDIDSEDTVMIGEIWENEKDLSRHLRSDEYQKILLVAEMAYSAPEIKFYTIVRTTGVETIRKARNSGDRDATI